MPNTHILTFCLLEVLCLEIFSNWKKKWTHVQFNERKPGESTFHYVAVSLHWTRTLCVIFTIQHRYPWAYQWFQGWAYKTCKMYRLNVKWQKCTVWRSRNTDSHCDTALFTPVYDTTFIQQWGPLHNSCTPKVTACLTKLQSSTYANCFINYRIWNLKIYIFHHMNIYMYIYIYIYIYPSLLAFIWNVVCVIQTGTRDRVFVDTETHSSGAR